MSGQSFQDPCKGQGPSLPFSSPAGGYPGFKTKCRERSELTLGFLVQTLVTTPDAVVDTIHRKTSTFFEMAILTGWLLGNGSFDEVPALKEAGQALGLAYQIADDIEDVEQDSASAATGKNAAMNYVLQFGIDHAVTAFYANWATFRAIFERLHIWPLVFQHIARQLRDKVHAYEPKARRFLGQ